MDNKIEDKKITDLIPDSGNANLGTERGLRALDDSLASVGLGRSVVTDKHGHIIAGNKTVERAADRGFEDTIVVHTDGKQLVVVQRDDLDLSDADPNNDARKLAFFDNRVAELDLSWNPVQLQADKDSGIEIVEKLWSPVELDILGVGKEEPPEDPGADVDRAAELNEKWQVVRGDIWQVGKHRIMCGDSTCADDVAKLMDGCKADMCLTDLPYGITQNKWDNIIPLIPMWQMLKSVTKKETAIILTASQPFTSKLVMSNLSMFKYEIIAHKTTSTGFLDCERKPMKAHENVLVFVNGQTIYNPQMRAGVDHKVNANHHRGSDNYGSFKSTGARISNTFYPTSVIKVSPPKARGVTFAHRPDKIPTHPTQKSIEWFSYLVNTYSNRDNVVLDICLGSGTTIVAAHQTNRVGYGMEIAPDYVSVCLERLAAMGLTPERLS